MNSIDGKLLRIQARERLCLNPFVTATVNHVIETNPSKDLPYHGTDHLWNVMQTVYLLMAAEGQGQRDIKVVTLAAIWHDYDHSGGLYPDNINIARANAHAFAYFSPKASELSVLDTNPQYICDLIKSTQFPYESDPQNAHMKYLRDADILSSFQGESGKIALGLFHELGKSGKLGETYPSAECAQDFMSKQREFLTSVKLFTRIGNTIRDELLEDVLVAQKAEFDQYIEAMNSKTGS